MNSKRIVVIGGGIGGYVAAVRASQLGARVTLIEKNKIGGTCLNRGCIPTKSLLFDAKLYRKIRRSPVFQSLVHEGGSPFRAMVSRKEELVQTMVKGVETLLRSHNVTVKHGRADLVGTNQVGLVDQDKKHEVIEADAIVLAPGSKPKALNGISPDGQAIITSEDALNLGETPRHILIVGGGYIGVEFAALFNLLGSTVTVVEVLGSILSGIDDELVRYLERLMAKDGIRILTSSQVEDVNYRDEKLKAVVRTPQGVEELGVAKILLALGRAPNLDLDFSRARVETAPTGIRVSRRMETCTPHIYAVGDAVGEPLLAHMASEQGVVAAENAVGIPREMEDHSVPMCIFTHPEIACVGLTEKEARTEGEIKIGRFPLRANPAALIAGELEGLVKVVIGCENDRILGVHIIGHHASTLISAASTFMGQGGKAKEFSRLIQAHPTVSEALKEAFLDADGLAIHLARRLQVGKR